jgi:iron complex transport system substrate-binding protein
VRIVSLVPHAIELLFALGLADQVIAVTQECDDPPQDLGLRRATRDILEVAL